MRSIKVLVLGLSLIGFSSLAQADYNRHGPSHGGGYGSAYEGQYCSVNGNYYPNCAPGLVCANVNYSGIGYCAPVSYGRCNYHSDCGYNGFCQYGSCVSNGGGWGGGHGGGHHGGGRGGRGGGRGGHGGGHRHHSGCGH